MNYLFALVIPIVSYLLQVYPRFYNRYFGVDVWSRMLETDLIRKNHHKIPKENVGGGFILEGYFNYPIVLPWFLSFISKKTLFKFQGFIAPIFDIIQNLLVFIATFQITGKLEIALIAQLVYATIPLAILENSYLTPRSLGYLNFTAAFYPLLLYSIAPNPLYLGLGFLFTVLSFFTHKFATQSILFISIFFSIYDKNPFYILVFLASLATAIIISKGYYLRIFEGHIANISFWTKNYEYRFAHQVRGLINLSKKTDLVGYIYYLLGTFTPVTLIGTNLWLIFPLFFMIDRLFNLHFFPTTSPFITDPFIFKMTLWVSFCYVFAALVLSIKYLIPIGEGQRYLEMALAPTAILTAVLLSVSSQTPYKFWAQIIFAGILITNLGLTLFLQWKGIIEDKNRTMTKDMKKIFTYINGIKPVPRILCIPHQITTMVLYNTKAKVLVDIQAGTLEKISDVYPILKSPVKNIAKKYNLDILILKKHYATMEELGLNKKSLLFETEDTQIIKI